MVVTPTLLARLEALGLLRPPDAAPRALHLLALCDEGQLQGGLSVALDVRADELVGPLTQRMGGAAARLKILEVRDADGVELTVSWPGSGETPHVWQVDGVRALVAALNQAFLDDGRVRQVAVLGEWNDALQLLCLTRAQQQALAREPWYRTEALG